MEAAAATSAAAGLSAASTTTAREIAPLTAASPSGTTTALPRGGPPWEAPPEGTCLAASASAGAAKGLPLLWTAPPPSAASHAQVALHPRRWLTLTFLRKEELSPDTRRFVFSRESRNLPFDLPVGQYVMMGADVDNRLVVRPYTPVHPIRAGALPYS